MSDTEKTAQTPNPIAGLHKAEIWALVEKGNADELRALDGHLGAYGYDAGGRVRSRIRERLATLTPTGA